MRWLFLLLVVLNLFYAVWRQQSAHLQVGDPQSIVRAQDYSSDIHLLSELDHGSAPQQPLVAVSEGGEVVCLFLGAFELEESAKRVEQRLLSLDVQSSVRELSATGGTDYWVYLAPLASRQASIRQLKELQARKIDSYIINQGDLANGISLGIFPRADSAESVVERLREAGYEPGLRELVREQLIYWVRISPESRRLADSPMLDRLAVDFAGLGHQLMPCESIATGR